MKTFTRAALASLLMMFAVDALDALHVLVRIGAGAVIYFILLILFGAITKETFEMLKKRGGEMEA